MANEKKMNMRTFLEAVVEADAVITEEMVEFATAKLVKMNETNEKNRSKERKLSEKELATKAANAAFYNDIVEYLTAEGEAMSSKEIAAHFDTTFQRVSSVIRHYGNGELVAGEKDGEKGKVKAYKIA